MANKKGQFKGFGYKMKTLMTKKTKRATTFVKKPPKRSRKRAGT